MKKIGKSQIPKLIKRNALSYNAWNSFPKDGIEAKSLEGFIKGLDINMVNKNIHCYRSNY